MLAPSSRVAHGQEGREGGLRGYLDMGQNPDSVAERLSARPDYSLFSFISSFAINGDVNNKNTYILGLF